MNTWIEAAHTKAIESLNDDTKARITKRRMIWPIINMPLITIIATGTARNQRVQLLKWVDAHTTSKFYLGGNKIGFTDDRDQLIFKLGFKFD